MNRIQELRKRFRYSQQKLANYLNVHQTAISQWETGRTSPDISVATTMAQLFNVSLEYLLGISNDCSSEPSAPAASNVLPLPQTYKVPLLGDIACGTPILAEENVERTVSAPAGISADFCLRCKGDSMIGARINDGDLVYIKQQDDVDDGQIAAVLVDDEATLKRVYRQGRSVILQAENPAYPPMIFTEADAKSIRIIGRAVAFLSRL